jgi:hypothetical protein
LLSTSFLSTTAATLAVRQFNTKVGAKTFSVVSVSVNSPVCLMRSLTLSLVKPNCVRMKAGVLSSSTARCSDQATSSAVTGLPLANFRPGLSSKLKVRPSALTVQPLARSPISRLGSATS